MAPEIRGRLRGNGKVIAHLTSVHPRFDVRIFYKMCTSLVSHNYCVSLIVADGKGDEVKDGIHIFDVGGSEGRFNRIVHAPERVFQRALRLNADLYHLHDPELIPIGLKLKKLGKRVIFDSHEDIPAQILSKPYLNKPLLWIISKIFKIYERLTFHKFDGIVAATPFIRDKLLKINANTININNFPKLVEINSEMLRKNKKDEISYVGSISIIRGIREIVQAMEIVKSNVTLNLCGRFDDYKLEKAIKSFFGWKRVRFWGFLNRDQVNELNSSSIAGLVIFHPLPNHMDAQPNKLFEYMSAGIPVIASDFTLWREVIAGNDCGLLVDPLNPISIAQAIDYLVTHPEEAQQMGANGRKAVIGLYNWSIEEKKLFDFYKCILDQSDK